MIKIENTKVYGFEEALRGMRNPMNSWDKSDSLFIRSDFTDTAYDFIMAEKCGGYLPVIKDNDLVLMKKLARAGTDHRKFMRMITVYADITAPLYWWKEFDTYKVGTVRNSCSTMHKITEKEFTLDDFSHEHLTTYSHDGELCRNFIDTLECLIDDLNVARELYIETKDKRFWWQIIQLLPSSYNQKATVMLNYEVLANIYKPTSRLHHRLDEWNVDCDGSFCKWIESLPYSELITGGEADASNNITE